MAETDTIYVPRLRTQYDDAIRAGLVEQFQPRTGNVPAPAVSGDAASALPVSADASGLDPSSSSKRRR